MPSQTEESAELLRPFRQAVLSNPSQRGTVRSHHRHVELDGCAMRPFVAQLPGTAGKQTGNVAFHYGATVATGTGQLPLVRRAFAMQARRKQSVADLVGCGLWVNGLDRLGDA